MFFFFFKRKTAYEMRISDWSSDVCSSDLGKEHDLPGRAQRGTARAVGEFDGRTLHSRGRHLARQRALPDQVIEPRVIARPGAILAEIGGADRLMRFLRILGLGDRKSTRLNSSH